MAEEFKVTAAFVCGLNPHPVTKLEGVRSSRIGRVFAPCIYGKARLPDNVREYDLDFPITIADATSKEKLEELRKNFHTRIDQAFDAFLARWEEAAKMIAQRENKEPRTLKDALKEMKAVNENETPPPDKGDDVGPDNPVATGN